MSITPAEWAALFTGAAWLGGLAIGCQFGWRKCLAWAAEEWEDEEPEPEPLLQSDLSVAAAPPGPPPPGMRVAPWWELEYEEQYADVLIPARFSFLAKKVRDGS